MLKIAGVICVIFLALFARAEFAVDGPPLLPRPAGDAGRDAARGEDLLFARVAVPGFTDLEEDIGGLATVDFNQDGLVDLFVIYDDGGMRMLLNRGGFNFEEHRFNIVDSPYTIDNPPGQGAIPNLMDFNGDGFLDIFITHNELIAIKMSRESQSLGNSLLLSQGRFDVFADRGIEMGVANQGAYNRQSSIGDVNGDGWLDIAVGADMIGKPEFGGKPVQRLYVYQPPASGGKFEDGKFLDLGGSDAVPGFGGEYKCDPAVDKSSPGILLRDFDGDGRLDLVQGYANDMLLANPNRDRCTSGENQFGIYAWRNATTDPAHPRFEMVSGPEVNIFGGAGRMKYDARARDYQVVSHGLGLKYITAFDAFNTGRLDLLAIGPTDPEFHVQSDMIAAAFFENRGPDFNFINATDRVGLESMNWNYFSWVEFFDCRLNPTTFPKTICALQSNRKRQCMTMSLGDHQIYMSTATFGDFNNDGNLDFIISDRHEDPYNEGNMRNVFYLNNGDGTFRLLPTEISGLDTSTISVEAADLNNDGLLDLVCGVQPTNTYPMLFPPLGRDRKRPKVYWNTGALGGRTNRWAQVILTGLPEQKMVGAQLYAYRRSDGRLLGRRDYFSNDGYKSGHQLMVHWGFGEEDRVELRVLLPGGRKVVFPEVRMNQRACYNVESAQSGPCNASGK